MPASTSTDTTLSRGARGRSRLRLLKDFYFIAPSIVLVGVLVLVPTVVVFFNSLFDWQPGYPSPFVGVENYVSLLTSASFHQVMFNELVFLLGMPLYTIVPVAIALILFEGVYGSAVYRTIFFFPSILSPAIVGIMFRSILAEDGMANSVLGALGLSSLKQDWLNNPYLVKPTLIAVITWAVLGVGVVIFSAALSALPPEHLEAARLDGANFWQRLRWIIAPELRPTIELWIAFQVITIFVGIFGWIYVLTSGGPNGASTTIDFDIYQTSLKYGFFGVGAAESVILLLIILLLGGLATAFRRFERRRARAGSAS